MEPGGWIGVGVGVLVGVGTLVGEGVGVGLLVGVSVGAVGKIFIKAGIVFDKTFSPACSLCPEDSTWVAPEK